MTEKKATKRGARSANKTAAPKVSTGAWWKSAAKTEAAPPAENIAEITTASEPRAQEEQGSRVVSPPETFHPVMALDFLPECLEQPVVDVHISATQDSLRLAQTNQEPSPEPQAELMEGPEATEPNQELLRPKRKRTKRSRKKIKDMIAPDTADPPSLEDAEQQAVRPEEALNEMPQAVASDEVLATEAAAEDLVEEEAQPTKSASYKLLINSEEPEECRIALLENGRLESFHVSTIDREATKNNIYKGRIVSIEPNLQVAFVEIGTGRNGFLPFSEIHPEYYKEDLSERNRELIAQQQWRKLKIEEVVQKGQEVLVQVVKEVTGNKGANMTTYLSLPGRCLVLLPGSDSAGISRKIVGEERRGFLRDIMSELELPEGIGYIIRTASADINKNALEQDLQALLTLWSEVRHKGQVEPAPALIYQEQDTVVRFLRDHFSPNIHEIVVDTEATLRQVRTFIDSLPPTQQRVRLRQHRGVKPIFNQHNIEEQIESIYRPQVPLPSGGSIVIDPTEALVAIDVNSGRTSKNSDFEESIFLANMEAAEELARQLRLRDLGGLIVVDFIDMRNKKHILEVERQVKLSMKSDKAKSDISRISRFGLMQISRQKMGSPIEKGSYHTCEYCQGRGVLRSVDTLALSYLRRIQTGVSRRKVGRVECRFPLEVAQYLLNRKREELVDLERKNNAHIDIIASMEMKPSEYRIDFLEADSTS